MNTLAWFIFMFLALRLLTALVNLLSRPWLRETQTPDHPLVSVLIPVRNEEENIAPLLERLLEQDYPSLEILVYDDLSADDTFARASRYIQDAPRIRVLKGSTLPGGWTGKNHACHQLATHARGDYLLFLDADVLPHPRLVSSAMAWMQQQGLKLLSLFPSQRMHSLGEKLTVPLMNWVLLSLLPLALTQRSPHPWLAAANGQFMLFEAATYHHYRFHQLIGPHKTEDIRIARLMKKKNLKIQTLLGGSLISCRMYEGFNQAVQGFSRSILEFFGGSLWAGPVFSLLTTLGLIPVAVAMGINGILIYLVMAMGIRLLTSLSSQQSVAGNLLLWPLQHASFLAMMLVAVKNHLFRKHTWKGRLID